MGDSDFHSFSSPLRSSSPAILLAFWYVIDCNICEWRATENAAKYCRNYFCKNIFCSELIKKSQAKPHSYGKNNFFCQNSFIFEFSAKNYPYMVGFITICKSSFFLMFCQILLLYEIFMRSFSTTEKRREMKFCAGVSFPWRNAHAKFCSDRLSSFGGTKNAKTFCHIFVHFITDHRWPGISCLGNTGTGQSEPSSSSCWG